MAGDQPLVIAITTASLLALGTLVIYHNHPLAMDEYAAYFQSRVFAAGELHVMKVPRAEFLRLVEREPAVSLKMLGELGSQIRRLETLPGRA